MMENNLNFKSLIKVIFECGISVVCISLIFGLIYGLYTLISLNWNEYIFPTIISPIFLIISNIILFISNNLNIFTCPYCNENFTYSFRYKAGVNPVRRTFDWDHIYSKTDYPFLAISFFNLIPCCKVCNFIKLDQNIDFFNPHLNINVNNSYFFLLNPTGAGFITDTSKLELNLVLTKSKYKEEFKNSISTIGLLDRYRTHKEIIKDILNKQRMYPLSYISAISNKIPLTDKPILSQLRATLYGNNFNHQYYYKRPFSKLTFDILNYKL